MNYADGTGQHDMKQALCSAVSSTEVSQLSELVNTNEEVGGNLTSSLPLGSKVTSRSFDISFVLLVPCQRFNIQNPQPT
jgi:hypothetical protein